MKKNSLVIIASLLCFSATFAQVNNRTDVYVRPGTEVHVLGDFQNVIASSSFTMDEEALLYVGGDLNNNGTFTMENDASLLRGAGSADGGSGDFFVKRQGSSGLVYNYWGTPVVASSSGPGNPTYSFDETQSTQDPNDDNNPNPDPGWDVFPSAAIPNMIPGDGYAGWSAGLVTFNDNAVNNGNVNAPMNNLHNYNSSPSANVPGTPFNLVGNPYPSGLDCAALVANNTGIFGSLYFWVDDATQGGDYQPDDYAIWNYAGTIPNPGPLPTGPANGSAVPNGIIKTGQGFIVRNSDSGPAQLEFRNTQRVANTASNAFFRVNADESKLWLSVNGSGPEFHSQILVAALEDATHNEDMLYDAVRLPANTGVSIAAVNGPSGYAILAFPPPAMEETIPLSVFIGENGEYTFDADEMIGFQNMDVFFTDTDPVYGTTVQLEEGTSVLVNLLAGNYENRFYLNFVPSLTVGIDEDESLSMNAWAFEDLLNVSVSRELNGISSIELFDMSGRLILSEPELMFENNRASISMQGISTGTYMVRVSNAEVVLSQKILKR